VHMVGRHSLLSLACARRKVQLLAGQYVRKLQATKGNRGEGEARMKIITRARNPLTGGGHVAEFRPTRYDTPRRRECTT
jgi:hypothetical protein